MTTSSQIAELRAENPGISNAEIARRLGVSRQAVWTNAKRHGLRGDNRSPSKWCLHCDTPLSESRRTFCSTQCRSEYAKVELQCDVCNKTFTRRTKELLWRTQHSQPTNHKTQQYFTCSVACRLVLMHAALRTKRQQGDSSAECSDQQHQAETARSDSQLCDGAIDTNQ